MAPARIVFLVLCVGRILNGLRIEGRIDIAQKGNDIRVRIADAADFEVVLVDIDDVELILPNPDLPQLAQLRPRSLQKLQGGIQTARNILMSGQRCAHDRGRP